MLEGENFLVLGEEWGYYPSTTEHLLRRLVPHNRFLWVHAMGCRAPQLNAYTVQRALGKLSRWASPQPVHANCEGLTLYAPPMLPLRPIAPVRWWNRRTMAVGISRRLKALNIERPILVTSSPMAAEVLDDFDPKLLVYYIVDNYEEMPHWYRDYVRELNDRLIARADLVFVTSQPLLEKSKSGRPAILLPQGVDFDHFHRPDNVLPEPKDLASIRHPRLVFMGLLAPWVDVELMAAVARTYSNASLVILGAVREDVRQLQNEPNVFFLGHRSYEDIPTYLAHCDVGLIPFRLNALTRYVNPLKLLEYMASGLQVVSTALPHVAFFDGAVRCASSASEFIKQVGRALELTSEADRQRCVEIARNNSWDSRAEQFSDELQRELVSASVGIGCGPNVAH